MHDGKIQLGDGDGVWLGIEIREGDEEEDYNNQLKFCLLLNDPMATSDTTPSIRPD